jgi:AbiV family abortive infection protein
MNGKPIPESIPWKTLPKCLHLSILNAKNLLKDASNLHEQKSYISASALSVLALEELGKGQIAFEFFKEQKDVSWSDYKKVFCNHEEKMKAVLKTYPYNSKVKSLLGKFIEDKKYEAFYVNYDWKFHEWFIGRKHELQFEDSPDIDFFNALLGNKAKEFYSNLQLGTSKIDNEVVQVLLNIAENCLSILESAYQTVQLYS